MNQRELKFLFVIREKHNHYYFLDDIKNYCENMNINIEEFLFLFKGNHEILIHYYLERLKNGKSIWIGKKYPISKENLYKYGSFILDVCQTVSLMFIKKNPKYSYLYDELKGYVMDQLLTTAGNFFDEMENEAILKHILSTYYIKVLSRFVINYENFSFYDSKTMKSKNNFFDDMNKNVDEMSFYENDLFIDHEYEILNTINMLVQNGYENYEDFVKQKYHLNDEEYSSVLSEIQRKILKKDNYFN